MTTSTGSPKKSEGKLSLNTLLEVLTAKYRNDATMDALKMAWRVGLDGLTQQEVAQGLKLTFLEHKFSFMPEPAEFRERALRRSEAWRGLGQRVDLTHSEFTTDEAGRTVITRLKVLEPSPYGALPDEGAKERARQAKERFFAAARGKGAGKGNIEWASVLGPENEEST